MNFLVLFAAWSIVIFLIVILFKGTIAAFINGIAGGEITNKTRSKILLGTLVGIAILSVISISISSDEKDIRPQQIQINAPQVHEPQVKQQKGIEFI